MLQYPKDSFTWRISEEETVQRLNVATAKDVMDSQMFNMFGARWYLRILPNGLANGSYAGHVFLCICLTALPANRSAFHFEYKLELKETNTVFIANTKFKSDFLNIAWKKDILYSRDLHKLNQFTITLTIQLKSVYDARGINVITEYLLSSPSTPNISNKRKKRKKSKLRRHNSLTSLLGMISPKHAHEMMPGHNANNNNDDPFGIAAATQKHVQTQLDELSDDDAKLNELEQMMQSMKTAVSSLSDTVKNMEEKLKKKQLDALFVAAAKQNQYELVVQEVDDMKLMMDTLQREEMNAEEEEEDAMNDGKDEQLKRMKQWLTMQVGLGQYFDVFVENGFVSMPLMSRLTKVELVEMGILSVGHQMIILQAVEDLTRRYRQRASFAEGNIGITM